MARRLLSRVGHEELPIHELHLANLSLSGSETSISHPPNSVRERADSQVTPKLDEFRQWYEVDSVNQPAHLTTTNVTGGLSNLPYTRLVQRNMPHYQSHNTITLSRRSKVRLEYSDHVDASPPRWFHPCLPRNWLMSYWSLFLYDWFHYFLRWHTYWAMIVWSIVWTIFVLFFAAIYYGLNHSVIEKAECKLATGFDFTFSTAFGFSLLTTTTVGYTLPGGTNSFFENCPTVQIAIYAQCIIALLFNALLISFLYARVSRAESRSRKLLFGNKAVIRPVIVSRGDGGISYRWTFEFRIFDLDACHPTVESHVRVYASLPNSQELQVCRLLRPADTLEGWVYTSVPYTVVHEIDIFSPLAPPLKQSAEYDTWFNGKNGLDRRASEARTLQTARWICPICSIACADLASLMSHIKYMKIKNKHSKMSVDSHSHLLIADDLLNIHTTKLDVITEDMLKKHLEKVEIICAVEGIEPITSGTFQALQSYTLDDIVFNGSFKNCIRLQDDNFVVDLDAFHHTSSKSADNVEESEQFT